MRDFLDSKRVEKRPMSVEAANIDRDMRPTVEGFCEGRRLFHVVELSAVAAPGRGKLDKREPRFA